MVDIKIDDPIIAVISVNTSHKHILKIIFYPLKLEIVNGVWEYVKKRFKHVRKPPI